MTGCRGGAWKRASIWLLGLLCACDPFASWPSPDEVFPTVYTPQDDLEPYESVRWETETWTPSQDLEETGLYVLKSFSHRVSAPDEVLEHFDQQRTSVPQLQAGDPTIAWVGDVMWLGSNWDAAYDPAASLLSAPLRVGNLETPTSPEHPTGQGELGLYSFNAPPELLEGLPLDVVQLNNNHSLDAGEAGLTATLEAVEARGIAHTGVGRQLVWDGEGGAVALLAYTWGLNVRDVTPERELYIVPFGHVGEDVGLDAVAEDVAWAREEDAGLVVAMLHWGFEYEYYPDPHFMVLARRLVSLGVDLVVGHGPHVAQPVELCAVNQPEVVPGVGTCSVRTEDGVPRTAAVVYSLANFGASPSLSTPQTAGGLVVHTSWRPGEGITGLSWTPVMTVRGDGPTRVVPLDDLEAAEMVEESARLDAHLGAGWRR